MNYSRARKIDRAQKIESLIKTGQLSPDGADWLTLRLDPYHDFQRPIAGYPDADSLDTIVSVRNYEYNVTKPAGSLGNWDAHVFTLPWDGLFANNSDMVNGQFTEVLDGYQVGLVNIAKDDAGAPLFPTVAPVASANFSMAAIDQFAALEAGTSRIIGMGLEVIDTTAALHKQGALTAYRMPPVVTEPTQVGYLNSAGTAQSVNTYHSIQSPPSTVAEVVLFRSSVQWEAPDGAYIVLGQEGISNTFKTAARTGVMISHDQFMAGTDHCLATQQTPVTALNAPPLVTASYHADRAKFFNVTQSGVMLTGLHNEATFKIRVRVYLERAPTRGDIELIPLATPSAAYDYKALELYSRLVMELPIAVPVGYNAHGDWWRIILRTIAKTAPIIGNLAAPFIGPEAMAIGSGVGSAAKAISELGNNKPAPLVRKKRPIKQQNKDRDKK